MTPLSYLQAVLNQLFFPIRTKIAWKGRPYYEKPIGTLPPQTDRNQTIINTLRKRYGVQFETNHNLTNTLRNYHLLRLFDEVSTQFNWKPPKGKRIIDIGSKTFYYASAIHSFFAPSRLVGIEIDGFHLYRGFYSNASYAEFYIQQLENTTYEVKNFKTYQEEVDGIIWQFPFLIKEDVLEWYLPLNRFEPERLFQQASKILSKNGFIFMVNSGEDEFIPASDSLRRLGFVQKGVIIYKEGLLPKEIEPYISLWIRESDTLNLEGEIPEPSQSPSLA